MKESSFYILAIKTRIFSIFVLFLVSFVVLGLIGCNSKSLDDTIQNKPSVTGVVEEVYENSIMIQCEILEGYQKGEKCSVSLDIENKDNISKINVGDTVRVYYNGEIAESDPLQINTVYAITLEKAIDEN